MAEAKVSGSGSASSSGGGDGGDFEWVTAAMGRGTAHATAGMSEEEIARVIETSREQGLWSELLQHGFKAAAPFGGGGDGDAALWEQLKQGKRSKFTDMLEGELKLGRLIAEGGQAQIYEASWHFYDDYVAKVFKTEGFSLAELYRQLPRKLRTPFYAKLQDDPVGLGEVVFGELGGWTNLILRATFLEDGRFAFLMRRYWGDLRTLIDLRVKNNSQAPPFSPRQALWIMRDIACGMEELHELGVLHRDLKAANVLVGAEGGDANVLIDEGDASVLIGGTCEGGGPRNIKRPYCVVADYESSISVVGTGFWKAPELLEELMKEPCDRKDDVWTAKVDVYSYAMTCYEVLTGQIPFYGYEKKDWKRVIEGERPLLPDYIDLTIQDLVERCWHKDPSKRPHFENIVLELMISI